MRVYKSEPVSVSGRGGARKNSWRGVSGLELPSKICELKCYKPKLLNLVSNYKPIVFQIYIIDREALLNYESTDFLERAMGVWGLAPTSSAEWTAENLKSAQ